MSHKNILIKITLKNKGIQIIATFNYKFTIMIEEEEKFSDDPTENMKIENEFLKLKMQAQFGNGVFMGGNNGQIPPEIENEFLKQVMQFEENYAKAEYITLYEKIGKPAYKKTAELKLEEIAFELNKLTTYMEEQNILLDINDGPYDDAVIYKFITEELFAQEVEKEALFEGGNCHFCYEEFHPNDKAEIERNTHEFLQHWFTKEFNEYSTELAYHFITSDGKQIDREAFFKKINMFFDSFITFKNDGYNIDEIKFELYDNESGMGHAEGALKYDAEMENGEIIQYEGPFKLYMEREDKYWSVMYFVMPGFVW